MRRSSSDASTNVTPRLACVKPAASVHPEPGSNSSSCILKYYLTITTGILNRISKMLLVLILICKMIVNKYNHNTRCQSIYQWTFLTNRKQSSLPVVNRKLPRNRTPKMNLITLLQYNFYSYELRLFLKAGANIQPLFNSTKLFWKKIKVFFRT